MKNFIYKLNLAIRVFKSRQFIIYIIKNETKDNVEYSEDIEVYNAVSALNIIDKARKTYYAHVENRIAEHQIMKEVDNILNHE
jgi:hypothetical protein